MNKTYIDEANKHLQALTDRHTLLESQLKEANDKLVYKETETREIIQVNSLPYHRQSPMTPACRTWPGGTRKTRKNSPTASTKPKLAVGNWKCNWKRAKWI